jgi:hypothetical protein
MTVVASGLNLFTTTLAMIMAETAIEGKGKS